jgi:hypothetical protein
LFAKLNPGARVIESQYGVVDSKLLLNTKSFDLHAASMFPGWKAELSGVQHKPETEEYGISSFVYRNDRPFHPNRFEELLKQFSFRRVMRSKGHIWVASDHTTSVEWSQAGIYITLKGSRKWLPLGWGRRNWPEAAKTKFKDNLYGDRRQELVFIGISMDKAGICDSLDRAIVTDEEFALGPEVWTTWTRFMTQLSLIPEDQGREAEFIIDLVKTDDDILGVCFDDTEGIRITFVKEGGLLHKWNVQKASENPELVVRIGYHIVSINGAKGMAGMELINSSTHLRVTISRLNLVATQKRFPFRTI